MKQIETTVSLHVRPRPGSILLGSVLFAIILMWSLNFFAGKIALRHFDPLTLAVLRMPVSAVIGLGFYLWKRPSNPRPIQWRDLWTVTYLSFFGVIVAQGCFTIGLAYTTSEHSVIIRALGPIMALALACVARMERLTASRMIGMLLGFAGVLLLELEQAHAPGAGFLLGDIITLGSTFGFAACAVLGRRVARDYDPITLNTLLVVISAVLTAPLLVRQAIHLHWSAVGRQGWTAMAYMSGISGVAAYTLFYWTLQYMEASAVTAVNYAQPVIVILLSIPILGEHPTRHFLFGSVLVLLGVYVAERVSLPVRARQEETQSQM